MLTAKEKTAWILENCVNKYGDINLRNLDFSEFEGNVYISQMRVKRNLFQGSHTVGGNLNQSEHHVGKSLYQKYSEVGENLHQGYQKVKDDVYQGGHVVGGYLVQEGHIVGGYLLQNGHNVGKTIFQEYHKSFETLKTYNPTGGDKVEENDNVLVITKKTKQVTMSELERLVGGKFEIVEE